MNKLFFSEVEKQMLVDFMKFILKFIKFILIKFINFVNELKVSIIFFHFRCIFYN